MAKGLFRQYFTIFVITLIASSLFLGVMLLSVSAMNYSNTREENLEEVAETNISVAEMYIRGGRSDFLSESFFEEEEGQGISVFLTDDSGNLLGCTEEECHHGNSVSSRNISSIKKNGYYFSVNVLPKAFGGQGDFIYGLPLTLADGTTEYLFVSSKVDPLYSYLTENGSMFLFSAAIMMSVALILIYTASVRLTAPLQEMSEAAYKFGHGDFSSRIKVQGDNEVAQLAQAFNQMADSLEKQEKDRTSFIANISHDLRTPMTTVGGYIDAILDGTIPPEEQEHYLRIASDEIKRLSRLTNTLLSIMRTEEQNANRKVELESVDAWDIIINIMLNSEQRIAKKNIQIPDFEVEDCFVWAEKDKLHQVIYNLIDNAVKYTPENGEIRISTENAGRKNRIVVWNSGKGIAKEEQTRVFERLYKTDKSRSIDRSGSGLGLYIVKMLANAMGGDILLESDGETYTQFTAVFDKAPKPSTDGRRQRNEEEEHVNPWAHKLLPEQSGAEKQPSDKTS